MANALGRDIQEGEVVVVARQYTTQQGPAEARAFRCEGGFGMSCVTVGEKVFGAWAADGERGFILGYMIDPAETALYQGARKECAR